MFLSSTVNLTVPIQAANAGSIDSIRMLGNTYYKGDFVPIDYSKSLRWFLKGAEMDDGISMFNLGVLYQQGRGVNKDYASAIEWYDKATKLDYYPAWQNLGYLIERGHGYKADIKKAIEYYDYALKYGVDTSHTYLARIYAQEMLHINAKKALSHAKNAVKIEDSAYHRELLAAAYAAKGQFNKAVIEQATAIAHAARKGAGSATQDFRLKRYREGKTITCLNRQGEGCLF